MKYRERIKAGIHQILGNKLLLFIPLIALIVIGVLTFYGKAKLQTLEYPFSSVVFNYVFLIFMSEIAILSVAGVVILIGYPHEAKRYEHQLLKVGFIDKSGAAPILLSKRKDKNGTILIFFSDGIPLAEYKKNSEEIETALNLKIVDVSYGKDMRQVVIKAIAATNKKQNIIRWNDQYLSHKDFELVLGESYFGTEKIDIAVTPHILIGGGSGSGKSWLLRLILIECLRKGAVVFLADLKGGVDYPQIWHKRCSIITESQELEKQLEDILKIMEERRRLFVEASTPNIGEYNKKKLANLPRIIVACDEVAEVLDKTGLEKDEKALIGRIENQFSTIARTGRAFGIHLLFVTQRPDADIIKGQIKSNMGYKVCGRADKILSQIILDNSDAADKISPSDQGMFLTNFGTLFKAYYIEDNCLEEGGINDGQAGTQRQADIDD